jgi:hypothetical protein
MRTFVESSYIMHIHLSHSLSLFLSHFTFYRSHEKLTIALLCVNDNNAQDVNGKSAEKRIEIEREGEKMNNVCLSAFRLKRERRKEYIKCDV